MRLSVVIPSAIGVLLLVSGGILYTPDVPRRELEAKYLRARGDLRDVGGTRLHVRDTGPRDGAAIVLIHGFGSSLHTWEDWATVLEKTYRVIRFDLPGSGLSSPDPTGIYTDGRVVDLTKELLDQLGVARATLVGNSIGGRVAFYFAAAHPDRVNGLVLISPAGFASPGFEYGKKPAIPFVARLVRSVLPKRFLRMNLAPAFGDARRLTDALVDRYYDLMLGPGVRQALLDRLEQTILEPPEPILRSIQTPVLLLWGAKDRLIPIGNAADYARELPHSQLVTFPELGHVPQEEDPAASVKPLLDFVAR